jgi:hypothetical protein
MDQTQLKKLAQRLHSYLKPQLGVAFKLGNALDLGCRLARFAPLAGGVVVS